VVYLLCLMLFATGILGVLTQRNLIKIIISLAVIESAINIFLVALGYRADGEAAIQGVAQTGTELLNTAVDPMPQAMVLAIIAIGVSVLVVSIVIALRLYHHYGTYDVSEINKLRG
jgi:multicomponent Na+:H+ antiporter subunit C